MEPEIGQYGCRTNRRSFYIWLPTGSQAAPAVTSLGRLHWFDSLEERRLPILAAWSTEASQLGR